MNTADFDTCCYYISERGDDANSGLSPEQAWKSVAKACSAALTPGTRLLFEGGSTFPGLLQIGPGAGGDADNPVLISSYGTGRAVLDAGDADGIVIEASSGITVEQINVAGSGRNVNIVGVGIKPVSSRQIVINQVEVWGFQMAGVLILGGCDGVRVTNVYAHDNGYTGIGTGYRDKAKAINRNIYVGHCRSNHNPGVSDVSKYIGDQSGSGINFYYVENGLIEFCETAYNGSDSYHKDNNGPVGIWLAFCRHVTAQFCISHHNDSYASDGCGFDFDSGCKNCIFQFNYSYRNKGCGYLLCAWNSSETHRLEGDMLRYCISENDSWHDDHVAGIYIHNGDVQSMDVYNNVIYNEDGRHCLRSFRSNPAMRFFNNIFILRGEGRFIGEKKDTASDLNLTIQNNCYWRIDGDGKWADCSSLEEFREKYGHEMLDGKPVGFCADPLLRAPGASGEPTDPESLPSLFAYMIDEDSLCAMSGLNLRKRFNIDTGETDFYGNQLPADGGCGIGIHQPRI